MYVSRRMSGWFAIMLISAGFQIESSPAWANESSKAQMTWDGQYIGASLGAAYGLSQLNSKIRRSTYFVAADKTQLDPLLDDSFGAADITGSMFWGYNKQKGKWVYGIEADLTLSDYNETHETGNITYVSQPANTFQFSTTIKSYVTASLRPRVGYIRNNSLFYVSAGPAISVFEFDFDFTDTFGPQSSRTSETAFKLGAAFNTGFEHKLRQDLSVRAGYLFTYFPNVVDSKSNLRTSPADGFDHDIDYQSHNFRIGLVKRF